MVIQVNISMMKDIVILSLLSVVSLALGDGMKWSPSAFPNPRADRNDCGRGGIKSSICDPGNFLENSQANYLDNLITKARNDTPCDCSDYYCDDLKVGGVKIGIALVEEMMPEDGGDEKAKFELQRTLEGAAQFAQFLDGEWKLGQCGESIIIFYSVKDHVLFTHTGDTTTKRLSNKHLAEISMNHRFLFEKGQYYEGLANLISDYRDVMLGRYRNRVQDPRRPAEPQALQSQSPGSSASIKASVLMFIITTLLHL